MSDDQVVSFTIKELLARLDVKVDTVIHELREKADRDELKVLEGRVDSLERSRDSATGASKAWRWVLPVLLSVAAVAATVISRWP